MKNVFLFLAVSGFSFMAQASTLCAIITKGATAQYDKSIYQGEVNEGEVLVLKKNGEAGKYTANELGVLLTTPAGKLAFDGAGVITVTVNAAQSQLILSAFVADTSKLGTNSWLKADALALGNIGFPVALLSEDNTLIVSCQAR